MQTLPKSYIDKMNKLLKEDAANYFACFDKPSFNGLRVNTSKISVEQFKKQSPFKLEPIPWTTNGFYIDKNEKPAKHPYYFAGQYYLQEPSAMTPASLLPIKEGDFVLDMCAAPGGKSTELGAKLNGSGLLFFQRH